MAARGAGGGGAVFVGPKSGSKVSYLAKISGKKGTGR